MTALFSLLGTLKYSYLRLAKSTASLIPSSCRDLARHQSVISSTSKLSMYTCQALQRDGALKRSNHFAIRTSP
eukprot:6982078-Pyramimonas_sp.AAC.1